MIGSHTTTPKEWKGEKWYAVEIQEFCGENYATLTVKISRYTHVDPTRFGWGCGIQTRYGQLT